MFSVPINAVCLAKYSIRTGHSRLVTKLSDTEFAEGVRFQLHITIDECLDLLLEAPICLEFREIFLYFINALFRSIDEEGSLQSFE